MLLVSTKLRQALQLMNHGGTRWAQGAFILRENDGLKFCSAGAINASFGFKGEDEIARVHDESRPALLALANTIRREQGETPLRAEDYPDDEVYYEDYYEPSSFDQKIIDVIASYNDKKERTWKDIVRVFTAAANRKAELGR